MNEVMMTLLFSCSVVTSILVQAIKKVTNDNEKIHWNIVAVIIALIVGGGTSIAYFVLTNAGITATTIGYTIAMAWLTALSSMIGYDKVVQILTFIADKKVLLDYEFDDPEELDEEEYEEEEESDVILDYEEEE